VIIEACGNTLLAIAAQPVFTVLQTNLARSTLGRRFHRAINEHHRAIIAAIAEGDADAAGGEMLSHLQFLRPFYEKAWRHAVRARARA
jgi:DNA-binding FadR family transcriptional regulator